MCYYSGMHFIVGLGNPGKVYDNTRHNLGFLLLDQLASKLELQFTHQKKCQADLVKDKEILLAKPQTFMNASGESVQSTIKYYGQEAKEYPNLFVVFDDLDLEVGHYKIQYGTGPKVHNGLGSIYSHLKTRQFWHVRLGADYRKGDRSIPAVQYVLGKFSVEEKPLLKAVFAEVITELEKRITQ